MYSKLFKMGTTPQERHIRNHYKMKQAMMRVPYFNFKE